MSAPTISNSFTTSTRYIYHTEETCTRVGNRVQFRGKMRNIRNDEYGEFLSFDGSKHYAKDTRPYKLSPISRCPWSSLADTLPRCFDTLRQRKRCRGANRKYDERACIIHAFERCHKVVLRGNTKIEEYVVELRKPLRHVEQVEHVEHVEQVEQVEQVEHVEQVEEPQHILVNVNTLQEMLKRLDELEQRVQELEAKKPVAITSTPAPPLTSPTKPDRPTPKTNKDQPEQTNEPEQPKQTDQPEQPEAKKKRASPTFQAMHEPEREGVVRFEVGTNNDCYTITAITHSPAGVKYVHYRIGDGDEVYRNTVYYEKGYEYFQNRGTGEDYWCKEQASDFA